MLLNKFSENEWQQKNFLFTNGSLILKLYLFLVASSKGTLLKRDAVTLYISLNGFLFKALRSWTEVEQIELNYDE